MNGILAGLANFAAAHSIAAVAGFLIARAMCLIYPPAPGLPVDLAAIVLFGPVRGFGLAELGIMLGATVAFLVARHARDSAHASAPRSRLIDLAARVARSVDHRDAQHQFCAWFTIRLRTNPLFDPLSYAGGLTGAQFYPFFLGTLVGNVPSIALFFVVESYAIAAGASVFITTTLGFGLLIWHLADRWLADSESFVA